MLASTVLGKIVDDKRLWLEARQQAQPLDTFIDGLCPSDRDFVAALGETRPAFILECKKASPSKGLIRPEFDLDYLASVYRNHASAISVLTDEKYFQGQFEYVTQVRSQVAQPVLCKDFIIDPYQIYLARHYQADAILLMLSVLDDDQYRALAEVACSLSMGILTEVSNEQELERAIALNAKVIGINNRNLRDLSIDLSRTKTLAPQIPDDRIIISESGIYTHQHVCELGQYAHGFLVGSSLMAQEDVELACRKLILGENKVCGLTRPEDASSAYRAGAVFGGLIFVESSPRHVSVEQARLAMSGAPLRYVGVFRNTPADTVAEHARNLGLAAVQLHGEEDQAYIDTLAGLLPDGCAIWKALGVSDSLPELTLSGVERYLLDTKVGSQSGGTGQCFDWQLLEDADGSRLMLAGGLTPENAGQASRLGCLGLDLNSGVESAPGHKDPGRLSAAFQAIRHQ